ncbi:MAG: hypothetical protein HYX22_02250 [Candidatus Yanofskybacteria bacterium]|nr:hypothetical protein [Candidatus Yanofskybacteria bacterium]
MRDSILATILYYNSFNFPLTFAEVFKYLINPQRLRLNLNQGRILRSDFNERRSDLEFGAAEIAVELENMARVDLIGHKNGFYFLPGREDLYEKRIEKDKLANRKWKKFLSIAKYLQFAPYLGAVFASGSLAANNPEPKSDFDVFVIVRSGRLYTGRFFLWLISSVLGARRGRFDVVAPDKLCFNHYLTDDNLELSHRGLYIAQSLANMRPVIMSDGVLEKFIISNKWASSYCYNLRQTSSYRNVKPNKIMISTARIFELFLDNFVGDLLEKILKIIQQKRIKKNPATYESGGRIIFNDKELEFHPRSFEKVVIDNYNSGLKKFGILGVEEKDSGLTCG